MGAIAAELVGAACGFALLLAPAAARAEAIDGHWCHKNGKRLSIEGPRIVTPNGTAMTGDYDRHGFSYVVPPGASGAGKRVDMALVDDDTMQLTAGTMRALPDLGEIWQRCRAPVS